MDTLVQQNLGKFLEDLEHDFKLFSLLILVVHTLALKIPSDATLASLSISIYSKWRPRWRPIISEKNVGYGKMSPTSFFLKLLAMKMESS